MGRESQFSARCFLTIRSVDGLTSRLIGTAHVGGKEFEVGGAKGGGGVGDLGRIMGEQLGGGEYSHNLLNEILKK